MTTKNSHENSKLKKKLDLRYQTQSFQKQSLRIFTAKGLPSQKSVQSIKVSAIPKPSNPLKSKGTPVIPFNKLSSNPSSLQNSTTNIIHPRRSLGATNFSVNSSGSQSALMNFTSNISLNNSLSKSPKRDTITKDSDDVPSPLFKLIVPEEDVNPDELFQQLDLPITPGMALKMFKEHLTYYEQGEILSYKQIYFLGLNAQKIRTAKTQSMPSIYDDERNDYKIILNDHFAYRYEVIRSLGKGSFGQVVQAFDHKLKTNVALKIIRNRKRFHYQAKIEIKILQQLNKTDIGGIGNIITLQDYFTFRHHAILVFELLSINLYEFIKANNYQGVSLNLIKRFAVQILQSLKHMKDNRIIHCDLKPENILLVQPNRSTLKIIDLGSACFEHEKMYTYIQSRFYRAPEILLGMNYTSQIDIWSFGCILAELYLGRPLFPGEDEGEQFRYIMEMIGVPPENVMKLSTKIEKFFNPDGTPILIPNSRGKTRYPNGRSLITFLRGADPRFVHLIERKLYIGCLNWNPSERITPEEALDHP